MLASLARKPSPRTWGQRLGRMSLSLPLPPSPRVCAKMHLAAVAAAFTLSMMATARQQMTLGMMPTNILTGKVGTIRAPGEGVNH